MERYAICMLFRPQLREYAKELNTMVSEKASDEEILARIEGFMENVFRIVAICLGIPPKTFTWEYYDKNKQYCVAEGVTPLEFYDKYVKPIFNVEEKVIFTRKVIV